MTSYRYKDKVELAFDANKTKLRAEGNIILKSLMNEALNEMSIEFNAKLAAGEIYHIGGSREDMLRFLRIAATKELGK